MASFICLFPSTLRSLPYSLGKGMQSGVSVPFAGISTNHTCPGMSGMRLVPWHVPTHPYKIMSEDDHLWEKISLCTEIKLYTPGFWSGWKSLWLKSTGCDWQFQNSSLSSKLNKVQHIPYHSADHSHANLQIQSSR